MVSIITFTAILAVTLSKVRHHQVSKHHHAQQPQITSSAFTVQNGKNYLNEGRFCALADVWDNAYHDQLRIKTRGVNFPIAIKNVPLTTKTLCIINVIDGNQTFFEYVNVKVNTGDVIFQEGKEYKDYGGSTAVLSQFQKNHTVQFGYLGPINYYGYANYFAGIVGKAEYHQYQLYAYFQTADLTGIDIALSQKDKCQQMKVEQTFVTFLSKSSYYLLLSVALCMLSIL